MEEQAKDTRTLLQRLHAAALEIDMIGRVKPAGMKYSIVRHDDVTAAVRPVLLKHGVLAPSTVVRWGREGFYTFAEVQVEFMNVDDPEDTLKVVSLGFGSDTNKVETEPGRAISYATKYCLLKALMLETGEDADLPASKPRPGQEAQQAPVQQAPAPAPVVLPPCGIPAPPAPPARDLRTVKPEQTTTPDPEELERATRAQIYSAITCAVRTTGVTAAQIKDLCGGRSRDEIPTAELAGLPEKIMAAFGKADTTNPDLPNLLTTPRDKITLAELYRVIQHYQKLLGQSKQSLDDFSIREHAAPVDKLKKDQLYELAMQLRELASASQPAAKN